MKYIKKFESIESKLEELKRYIIWKAKKSYNILEITFKSIDSINIEDCIKKVKNLQLDKLVNNYNL